MRPGSGPDTESDAFTATIDEIVAALDQEPVLVEEVLGNGHTEAIREALSEKAAASPIPVHVVLTLPPAEISSTDPAEELLSVLHNRVGTDGVWVVAAGDVEVGIYTDLVPDDEYDDTRLSSAVREALADVQEAIEEECGNCTASTPALEAAVTLDVLAAGIPDEWDTHPLSREQIDAYATSTWWDANAGTPTYVERAELPTSGTYAMVATVTALCVMVVSYRLVQAIGGTRHKPLRAPRTPEAPTPAQRAAELSAARQEARAAHRALAKALERTKVRPDDATGWERREIATACLERAESRRDSDDLLEVVGALVLARTGTHALGRKQGQYQCCYVDPRHGSARMAAQLGGGLRVQVCRACADALAQQRRLEPLMSGGRLGSWRPYYERTSVWSRSGFGSLGGDWWREVPR